MLCFANINENFPTEWNDKTIGCFDSRWRVENLTSNANMFKQYAALEVQPCAVEQLCYASLFDGDVNFTSQKIFK